MRYRTPTHSRTGAVATGVAIVCVSFLLVFVAGGFQ